MMGEIGNFIKNHNFLSGVLVILIVYALGKLSILGIVFGVSEYIIIPCFVILRIFVVYVYMHKTITGLKDLK